VRCGCCGTRAPRSGSTGRVSLVADEVHLGEDGLLPGHGGLPGAPGVVTGQCNCAFTGAPHPVFSSVVKAVKGV